jgi:hypothetical protein
MRMTYNMTGELSLSTDSVCLSQYAVNASLIALLKRELIRDLSTDNPLKYRSSVR